VKKLVVATKNEGKAREVAQILADLPLDVVSLADYPDAPEVEETGSTFIENATIKAVAYAAFTGELTLADDSGLEVDALNGAPGVFSSRFAPTTPERNAKLLDLMRDVPDGKRAARFRCAIAVATPQRDVWVTEGTVEGVIAREEKGTHGFGYDPVFYLPNLGKHMAELTPSEKNAISHRGKALSEARKLLKGFIESA
jgi:XTP/dITP diphosphohydrolase